MAGGRGAIRVEREFLFEIISFSSRLYGAFTMDTVAWCGFGLKVDSQRNKDDEFVLTAQKAFSSKGQGILFLASECIVITGFIIQKKCFA